MTSLLIAECVIIILLTVVLMHVYKSFVKIVMRLQAQLTLVTSSVNDAMLSKYEKCAACGKPGTDYARVSMDLPLPGDEYGSADGLLPVSFALCQECQSIGK